MIYVLSLQSDSQCGTGECNAPHCLIQWCNILQGRLQSSQYIIHSHYQRTKVFSHFTVLRARRAHVHLRCAHARGRSNDGGRGPTKKAWLNSYDRSRQGALE